MCTILKVVGADLMGSMEAPVLRMFMVARLAVASDQRV